MQTDSSNRSITFDANTKEETLSTIIMSPYQQQEQQHQGSITTTGSSIFTTVQQPRFSPSQSASLMTNSSSLRSQQSYGSRGVKMISPMNLDTFNKDCLKAHNDYRRAHFAPALRLSDNLQLFAQAWADVNIL